MGSWLPCGRMRETREELAVAVPALDRAREVVAHDEPFDSAGAADAGLHARVGCRILDQPALADVLWLQFELGLDEQQREACRAEMPRDFGQHECQRDERQ